MRIIVCVAQVLCIGMLVCVSAAAADEHGGGGDGGFKLDLSSLPLFGDSKEEESGGARGQEYVEPTEYTYDATGRKVPVQTERSGIARPIK